MYQKSLSTAASECRMLGAYCEIAKKKKEAAFPFTSAKQQQQQQQQRESPSSRIQVKGEGLLSP